jgi:hypothetical protein
LRAEHNASPVAARSPRTVGCRSQRSTSSVFWPRCRQDAVPPGHRCRGAASRPQAGSQAVVHLPRGSIG